MSWLFPLDIGLAMGLIFVWPVLAFAASFRLMAFPDLTLEGSLPTGAAVFAVAAVHGWSLPAAILAAMLAGACLGALTAIVHLRFRVNKFLAGIIVVAISFTLDLRIMGGANVGLIERASVFDYASPLNSILGLPLQLGTIGLLALVLLVGVSALLAVIGTSWGLRLRVAGSNPAYARAIGIRVPIYLIAGLAVTNALVAGSAGLLAMYQGFADVGMGQGVLILALASMTIGERLTPERRFSIPIFVICSALVGSLLYQILIAYAVRLGLAATDLKLATAIFVLVVIAVRIKKHDEEFLEGLR
jgi:putative tryptophan/tyrosine transport system permease protein